MKKKLFYIFAILALMLPCFALAGCGGGAKRAEIWGQNQIYCKVIKKGSFVQNGTNCYYDALTLDSVELNTEVTYDIVLDDSYDADTLKLYANGSEITWTKNSEYDDDRAVNKLTEQLVGSFSLTLTENIEITIDCKEKNLEFGFAIKDDADLTDEQKSILNDFYVTTDKTLLNFIENNWSVGKTFNEIVHGEILLECNKKIGYYNTSEFLDNATLTGKWTESKNEYYLSNLAMDSETHEQIIKKHNTLYVKPEGLKLGTFSFKQNVGSIVEITSKTVDLNDPIKADANAEIFIGLAEKEGIDVENAELYINGTKVEKTGTHWVVLTSKLPIEYLEYNAEYDNYSSEVYDNISHYNIEVKNVVVTDETKLTKIVGTSDQNANIRGISYFYTPAEGVYYAYYDETVPGDVGVEFYMGGNTEKNRYIVIVKNGDTENATVVDVFEHIINGDDYITVDGYDIAITMSFGEPILDNLYSVTVYAEKAVGVSYTVMYTNNINN